MSENQYVVFELGEQSFGVDIAQVWEIINFQTITKVPHTAAFIEGIINLRGKVIPVLDLRKRFGISLGEQSKSLRIVVMEMKGNTVGMIVDGVSEVLRIGSNIVEPAPSAVSSVDTAYLAGVAKLEERLVILLDLTLLLSEQEHELIADI